MVSTNRIREVRSRKHVTLEELADQTGISPSFLSRIEASTRGLNLENALKIAQALKCEVSDITDAFSPEDVDAGSKLDWSRSSGGQGDVPNLIIHAGMGNGGHLVAQKNEAGEIASEFIDGYWTFPESIRAGFDAVKQIRALPVRGDSMEPTLKGGSIAFIDIAYIIPSPADLYAVDYGDGLMIKRIELVPRSKKVRVISDNQRYGQYEMSRADLLVFGRVVASFQWRD